jgi:hypothetical protein
MFLFFRCCIMRINERFEVIMKRILLLGMGVVFTTTFMMEEHPLGHEAPMVRCTSLWDKICDNGNEVKDFLTNNTAQSIVVTAASAGVGYGVHLGIEKINENNEGAYIEWLKKEENKKKIGFGLSILGGLLGFAALVWSNGKKNGKKNALLEQINYFKELKIASEDNKSRLEQTNRANFSDIEIIILNEKITKQDSYIEFLNYTLNDLEKKLNIIK